MFFLFKFLNGREGSMASRRYFAKNSPWEPPGIPSKKYPKNVPCHSAVGFYENCTLYWMFFILEVSIIKIIKTTIYQNISYRQLWKFRKPIVKFCPIKLTADHCNECSEISVAFFFLMKEAVVCRGFLKISFYYKETPTQVFPVKFAKLLRTPVLQNISGGCFSNEKIKPSPTYFFFLAFIKNFLI